MSRLRYEMRPISKMTLDKLAEAALSILRDEGPAQWERDKLVRKFAEILHIGNSAPRPPRRNA